MHKNESAMLVGCLAVVLLAVGFHAAAHADDAASEPENGLDYKLGGSVQVDGNWIDRDDNSDFGSGTTAPREGIFLRRVHGFAAVRWGNWMGKIEPAYFGSSPIAGGHFAFEDLFVAAHLGPGDIIVGQRRPFRGMEDLTNSDDLLLIERPFAGAGGLFREPGGRDYALGAFYQGLHDHVGWGAGAYSLKTITDDGSDGFGASARVTYAPMVGIGETVHLGLSTAYEKPRSGSTDPEVLAAAVSYVADRGPLAVIGFSQGEPTATLGAEFGATLGALFVQAEFMAQRLQEPSGQDAQTLLAYYVEASYAITGEARPYDLRSGTFGSPSPSRSAGALEVAMRYDGAGNLDAASIAGGCGGSTAADQCEVQAITVGVNYYFTSHVRLMLDFTTAEQDRGAAGTDTPNAFASRLQIRF